MGSDSGWQFGSSRKMVRVDDDNQPRCITMGEILTQLPFFSGNLRLNLINSQVDPHCLRKRPNACTFFKAGDANRAQVILQNSSSELFIIKMCPSENILGNKLLDQSSSKGRKFGNQFTLQRRRQMNLTGECDLKADRVS